MSQSYNTGAVAVTAGSDIVVGSGTAWALASATGGLFCCMGISVPGTVIDDTHLKIDFVWPGASGSGLAYSIFRETAQAASAVLANDRLAEAALQLKAKTLINFDEMGTLVERAAYDSAPKGFVYLDLVGSGGFEFYIKASVTNADWAGPGDFGRGPKGDPGPVTPIEFVAPEALAPGTTPTVTNTGTALAPKLKFGIPQGEKGTDGTGTGDVVGPAGVTDNALVRFDTATGKKIKAGAAIQTAELGDAQVTLAKLANIATASLLGRATAASGVPEVLTVAQVKTLLAIVAADITNASADGKTLLTLANYAAMFAAMKQAATTTATGATQLATAANYRSNAAGNLALSPTEVWAATDFVALTNATTIAVDLSAGLNFAVTITANRTLGAPTNAKPGQCGVVAVTASAATRTIAKNAVYKSDSSITWPISIAVDQTAYFYYAVIDASNIVITGVLNNPV